MMRANLNGTQPHSLCSKRFWYHLNAWVNAWVLALVYLMSALPARAEVDTRNLLLEPRAQSTAPQILTQLRKRYSEEPEMLKLVNQATSVAEQWATILLREQKNHSTSSAPELVPLDPSSQYAAPLDLKWRDRFFWQGVSLGAIFPINALIASVSAALTKLAIMSHLFENSNSLETPIVAMSFVVGGTAPHWGKAAFTTSKHALLSWKNRRRSKDLERLAFAVLHDRGVNMPHTRVAEQFKLLLREGFAYLPVLQSQSAIDREHARFLEAISTRVESVPIADQPFLREILLRLRKKPWGSIESQFEWLQAIKRDFAQIVYRLKLEFAGVRDINQLLHPAAALPSALQKPRRIKVTTDSARPAALAIADLLGQELTFTDPLTLGAQQIQVDVQEFLLTTLDRSSGSLARVNLKLKLEMQSSGQAPRVIAADLKWNTQERAAIHILEADRAQWLPMLLSALGHEQNCSDLMQRVSPIQDEGESKTVLGAIQNR